MARILGLAWRSNDEIIINPDRPFIPDLNDLPIPLHERLPIEKQIMPMIKGPFTFIVTSSWLSRWLQVLHQTCHLPKQRARALC